MGGGGDVGFEAVALEGGGGDGADAGVFAVEERGGRVLIMNWQLGEGALRCAHECFRGFATPAP